MLGQTYLERLLVRPVVLSLLLRLLRLLLVLLGMIRVLLLIGLRLRLRLMMRLRLRLLIALLLHLQRFLQLPKLCRVRLPLSSRIWLLRRWLLVWMVLFLVVHAGKWLRIPLRPLRPLRRQRRIRRIGCSETTRLLNEESALRLSQI